jgi:pimeloyl-ACP methyl ester carboxylesterase
VLPFLARTRRVIARDEQGHGRTSDRDQPFTFEDSADDVAGLLEYLHVAQADLLGFSNGASVALQVAIRHPQLVRKLVFASSLTKREGAQPQVWEFIKQADITNMPQALKDAFLAIETSLGSNTRLSCRGCSPMRGCSSYQAGTAITLPRRRARWRIQIMPRSRLGYSNGFS